MVTKIFKMIEQWTVVTDTRLWIMVKVSKWLPWELKKGVRSFRVGRLRERALVSDQVKRVFYIRRAVTYESF